mgnify:FL=1
MKMFNKVLASWEFWTMVGLFFLGYGLMSKIESLATNKDTLLPILGFLPIVAIWYVVFVKPTRK